jgi:class 3 adenylate cyclase
MSRIRRASLDDPASFRSMSRGVGSLAVVGPLAIGRARLEPGWRWSVDLQPRVGTTSCQAHHLHLLVHGRFAVQLDGSDEVEEFQPGDVFDIPPGHDAWVVGDVPVELFDVSGNSAEFGLPASTQRVVATMLMTDIVDSTAIAARLGDAAWRQALAGHNRLVRSQLGRFRGRELDTTGDGFFATFDSAAAALECARAIRTNVLELGLQVRIGVHTGEIEITQDDVGGLAVHAAARVMAAAGPSEILTSTVTRVLAEGSGIRFEPHGTHDLKGIPAPMELFAVV